MNKEGAVLAFLLMLFVCRAVLASATVPPWQGPDEPTHFSLIHSLANSGAIADSVQEQVLRSMAAYRWWEPYGGRSPNPLPTTFRQIQRLSGGVYDQPLYYGVGAGVLRITRPATLETSYWHLRILSVLLGLATLALGWAGTRLLFGPGVAAGGAAMAALHPQFLLTSISVNPDALLNVCGAFMWWQVARVLGGHRRGMSLMLLVTAAVAAPFIKRSAMPLVAITAVMVVVSIVAARTRRITIRDALLTAMAVVVGAAVLLTAWLSFPERFTALGTLWRYALNIRRPLNQATVMAAVEYTRLSIDYVWLVGGWLRFPAPEAWLWIARTLTVVGFAGAAVLTIRLPGVRRPSAIAWLFVIIQAATVVGWGFITLSSPQGRYLFPVIAPATALLWLGLTQGAPARVRPYAGPTVIAILAVLDVTGSTSVLIPAYLPWG